MGVTYADLAAEDTLLVKTTFTANAPTFPFGAHLAVVEVDTGTGKAVLQRVVTVDDAGRVLNPLLAEGQRHGGIAQGAAQALFEEVLYDGDGNPLTSTLADHPIPSAAELPSFDQRSPIPATICRVRIAGGDREWDFRWPNEFTRATDRWIWRLDGADTGGSGDQPRPVHAARVSSARRTPLRGV